jgi:type IV pilus assembly protein PilQ
MRICFLLFMMVLALTGVQAQDRFAEIRTQLEASMADQPGLDERVEMSVSGTPVSEFVRALGLAHKLNISVDPAVKGEVVNTFSNAQVTDVLLYLCKTFDLELERTGSILDLRPYRAPEVQKEAAKPTPVPMVTYRSDSAWIDLDLHRDTLEAVARAINLASGSNVVLAPGLEDRAVSVFLRNSTLTNALDKLAYANGLLVDRSRDGTFLLKANDAFLPKAGDKGKRPAGTEGLSNGPLSVDVSDGKWLKLDAQGVERAEVLAAISLALGKNYFLYDPLEGTTSLSVEQATFDEVLDHMFNGSAFTYKVIEGVYLIGKREQEGLRRTELVRLHNRPVKDMAAVIPEGIRKNVTISEFVELNGFVISGDDQRITEIKDFLRSIDQTVPVVMIEVMIVDVNRSRTLTTGLKAGLGNGPTESGGTISPGINYNLNANSINSLLNSFNGAGVFNLGNVAPSFYVSIQALETDGVLKLRSTPQLSTLNGHEATLSIGETEYYLEVRNDLIGTQNPTVTTSQIYKPINADLSLKILPIVSSEDMVTLDIEVSQSTFTDRISETAPPGSVQRKFSSSIRMKDREMIVLGGLEEKETSQSGSGLPFLSRIPVLKWIFGSRTKKNSQSKLTIFIRPTIIY